MPDTPGVYFFKQGKTILYIGRATSLSDRVKSYFSPDIIATRGPRIVDMVAKADSLSWVTTASVLEAVVREAALIREHQPVANEQEKDDKSFNWVVLTNEAYPALRIVRGRELALYVTLKKKAPFPIGQTFGPFPKGALLKDALRIMRRIFPFRDEKCHPESGRPCFNYQIGLCPGTCVGAVTKKEYTRTIRHLALFFSGRVDALRKTLQEEMQTYAEQEEFELAGKAKQSLYALDHIQDVSLLRADTDESIKTHVSADTAQHTASRIEAFDIAHLQGSAAVGVMAVYLDGELRPDNYRTFTLLSTKKGDDAGGLREILSRRLLHEEWGLPDLVVVDGSAVQRKVAVQELAKVGLLSVPVVAVTKDDKHKPRQLYGAKSEIHRYEREILLVNAEAHRFAIKTHRKKSRRSFLA